MAQALVAKTTLCLESKAQCFGKHHTEETKKKIAMTKIGDKNPAKRPDVRQKISQNKTGKKPTITEKTLQYRKTLKNKKRPEHSIKMKEVWRNKKMIKKISKDEMPTIPKGWGHELVITNNIKYCGKILSFNKDKKLSIHFHKIKSEHFYVQKGKIVLTWMDAMNTPYDELLPKFKAQKQTIEMLPGDAFSIPTFRIHQILALEDSEIIEFSTTHFDNDSFRLEKGD